MVVAIAPENEGSLNRAIADITDRCILASFYFAEMDQRRSNISKAHRCLVDARQSTFDWVFKKEGSGFAEWLEGNNGLFWINGKAGSGKSTLMKFIAEDSRLQDHLMSHTQSRSILFASFFFWAAGTTEQKSQQGLFSTLLYTILSQRRELIKICFPDTWNGLYETASEIRQEELLKELHNVELSTGRRVVNAAVDTRVDRKTLMQLSALAELRWTRRELLEFIASVISSIQALDVFLLVDGLDEYDSSEDDLGELVSLLKSWAQLPNLKICVSTRPWNVFETNFGNGAVPSFRLQDLTFDDITAYVTDSFNDSPSMQIIKQTNSLHITELYSSIAVKAEGVFLWVRLVVKSLINGLQNGDELFVLQERVNELPADLEKLYRHMLQQIPERYWGSSSRLFRIMEAAEGAPHSLLLWYAGERAYSPLETQLSDSIKMARCYQLHLRLMSQCCGLLEVRTGHDAQVDAAAEENIDLMRPNEGWAFSSQQHYIHSTVHYLHRTTRDFLAKSEITKLLNERLAGSTFEPCCWLAIHALIAVHEVLTRIERIRGHDIWDTFGFELKKKHNAFHSYLSKCEDRGVAIARLLQSVGGLTEETIADPEKMTRVVEKGLSLIDSI